LAAVAVAVVQIEAAVAVLVVIATLIQLKPLGAIPAPNQL
jgi:hypothetical protein